MSGRNIEVITGQLPVNLCPPKPDIIWMSPLDICFSQNVIYPTFTDGKSVDDAVKSIHTADGEGDDVVLDPPFPMIEVVRWTPKLRDGAGKPLQDENGKDRLGSEGLFTIDNRRLYALQRVAVAQYPRRCKVEVAVLKARDEIGRHLKKFRTRMNGRCVNISEWNGVGRDNAKDFSAMRIWDWRSAVQSAVAVSEGGKVDDSVAKAAQSGSCGAWEYLDGKGSRRGPFSNEMMRQWWQRGMLPKDLRIRAYDVAATVAEKAGEHVSEERDFAYVVDVFREAPEAFAPGWSPQTTQQEREGQTCGECGRKRIEGWCGRGTWYCINCWKRWENDKT
eukprot:TRINITY_DN32792_c0_g1_i1.p1 TRINITY_DN32792_c0_g1~~TRINITY_DN32792_c0_g1_i1.p1  ORF type:complete len:334 (-),score=53.63 TRINITY_DN32792_c0_g1_i1:2-1003(-)